MGLKHKWQNLQKLVAGYLQPTGNIQFTKITLCNIPHDVLQEKVAELEDEVRWHARHSMVVWPQKGTAARMKPSSSQVRHAPAPEKASLSTAASIGSRVWHRSELPADFSGKTVPGGESILFKLRTLQIDKWRCQKHTEACGTPAGQCDHLSL